jgi:hypothetical protein
MVSARLRRFGLCVAALRAVQLGQVVEAGANAGVIGSQSLLVDGERPLVKWLGLCVATLRLIEQCQVVERPSHSQMADGSGGVSERPKSPMNGASPV